MSFSEKLSRRPANEISKQRIAKTNKQNKTGKKTNETQNTIIIIILTITRNEEQISLLIIRIIVIIIITLIIIKIKIKINYITLKKIK
jgi:hypothetical protein